MDKTPGVLDPFSFDSEEEFRAALEEQGRGRGWTRVAVPEEKPATPQEALAQAKKRRR